MKYELPRQLRYETLARGPAARAYRVAEAIAAAKPGNGLTGDGWMLRLISAGVTALACLALGRHAFIPAAWILTSIGVSIAASATHCVGWALSVQIGARIEWGAICFVISTTQIRYEDSTAILPSIGFYLTQHVAQFLLLHFGVSLDFIWHGAYDATTSLLAVMLAVLQGSVIVEITRALTRRHATAIHANPELTERAAQAEAQAAELLRTEAIMRAVIGGSEDAVAVGGRRIQSGAYARD